MIDPIIITGCARSGTSLVSGIIHQAGAFGGKMFGGNKNNAKGFFENSSVRQDIVKPYLKSIGVDPMGQKPLPRDPQVFNIEKELANKWRLRILNIFKQQGYQEGPWFYKGAKCCLIWYLWYNAFPQSTWIIVRRTKKDIISSCMRTSFMRGYRNVEGWRTWVEEHERRFNQIKKSGASFIEVWPQDMIEGNFAGIKAAIEKLGLSWDEQTVKKFVAPELWRGGK